MQMRLRFHPITVNAIPAHLRLDLGIVWEPKDGWEIGLFDEMLLEAYHIETMYPGIDVEPARVERTFYSRFTRNSNASNSFQISNFAIRRYGGTHCLL